MVTATVARSSSPVTLANPVIDLIMKLQIADCRFQISIADCDGSRGSL
jgi:hypothetical protein